MKPVLAVEDLWKFYGDVAALRRVGFTVAPGACLAVLGRNGAGKTTLLRILAGLSRPARGRVEVFGAATRESATRARIGVLGHGIGIYDELSALENLQWFGRLYGLENPRESALWWLRRTGLERVKDARAREFSRGMRQRLAVARVFLHEPSLLLLDEPFTALDDRAIALVRDLLREAVAAGRTVLISTHQLREALEVATHVAVLDRGRLVYHGERTEQMRTDTGWLYRHYGET